MKKCKLLFIFFCLLFLTACTAEYQLNIMGNNVNENLSSVEKNLNILDIKNDSGWTLREVFDSFTDERPFEKSDYSIEKINNEKEYGIKYNNEYSLEELDENLLIKECYPDYSLEETDTTYRIESGSNFKCFTYYQHLETLTIKVKTNHKVLENNADKVSGNVYTWNITKNGNKNIVFEFTKEYSNFNIMYVYLGLAGIIVAIIISVIVFINKKKKCNAI